MAFDCIFTLSVCIVLSLYLSNFGIFYFTFYPGVCFTDTDYLDQDKSSGHYKKVGCNSL